MAECLLAPSGLAFGVPPLTAAVTWGSLPLLGGSWDLLSESISILGLGFKEHQHFGGLRSISILALGFKEHQHLG